MPDTEYKIRTATEDDAAALLKIYDYYVRKTAITFEYDTPSLEEFTGRIRNIKEKFPYLVIEQGKEILGYAYASSFHPRAAYQWCVEMTIYIDKDVRRGGLGRMLYTELERQLKDMGILNLYACIGYPDEEDEHLTFDSVHFHEKMGYKLNGKFTKCGYKFNRWYNMVWMEKLIGEHN
ncbi:N-acetyltransferase [Butyrivibrio sp. CB08]|uniref:GNAT family N-acetyltransferase n=1 Tax=Butyrivibrio sp. CB08 TaxID=2364879 RepID=UPI000EA90A4B|nr:GNAT family N-acetyltransferase [Butyrivibrio sp. CB08]RKM61307.1 N-acetyltransferase [Butyrivibrio sp. CB08]